MPITLYKKGDTHTVSRNGKEHKCRMQNFAVKHLQAAINAGWCTDPTDIKTKPGRKPSDPLPSKNAAITRGVPDAPKD